MDKFNIREISEIKPFQEDSGIFHLPESKIIGKGFIHPPGTEGQKKLIEFLGRTFNSTSWRTLINLPGTVHNSTLGFSCDYVSETDSFTYIACVLVPLETSVPAGFYTRYVPETLVSLGKRGENMDQVRKRMNDLGYVTNYDAFMCTWDAELYFGDEEQKYPKESNHHWLVPCRKKS